MRLAFALLSAVLVARAAVAQPPALPDRAGALVAAGRTFVFYSDAVTNLHDFLVWNARSREPVEPLPDCFARLSAVQRTAFEQAREHYKVFATPAGNRLLLALRYRLAGFGDFGIADAAAIGAAITALKAAAPAYEQCWWPAHDARNRRWVAALEPMLAAHEDALSERLSVLYGSELRRPFPVDVVSYGSFAGADSVVDPDHLLVSSLKPSNAGYAALEIVFHEASHTVFGPGLDGQLWTDLEASAKADGAPLAPDFWHAMLFYTTGSTVKARLAERGIGYEQSLYTEGLFERSWPWFRQPLERLWQPHLDGRVPRTEALKLIVAAHKLPDRGETLVAASRTFAFYSDLGTNLHDFLLSNARSEEPVEPRPACLAGVPPEQRAAFEHAIDHYRRTFANGAGDLVLLSMRWRLAKLGDVALADEALIAATVAELAPATSAYQTCWWEEHDARNRRWVASLLPVLNANEDALRARLAELYGQPLARSLPVDVVGYTSIDGGSPVLNPHHLLISSARPSTAGYSALEVLFREASQTIFGPRAPGPLWETFQQASKSSAKKLPDDFSLLLLLFTTGRAVQARLAEQGVRDYNPYVFRERLLERVTPEQRKRSNACGSRTWTAGYRWPKR
ncbi:MAG TPA: hypothetical protein VFV95_13210 [Vicinamibacterales bacterium]|nr:hypothetical protein [Vicinamibacterales bacterium]